MNLNPSWQHTHIYTYKYIHIYTHRMPFVPLRKGMGITLISTKHSISPERIKSSAKILNHVINLAENRNYKYSENQFIV